MVTREDYTDEAVEQCLSVMVEIMTVLGEYRDHIVLVGGWVPFFLLPDYRDEHTGSLDVDLALDHEQITEEGYRTILQLLERRGYRPSDEQPFIFYREIPLKDREPITVQIDLLSAEYSGTSKSHRTQRVQDVKARKARGSDLAFEDYSRINIKAKMPDGAVNEVAVKVSNIIPFIVMKGMALWESKKEKHPWDIYFIIRHYPGGIESLAEIFKPFLRNKLVIEGLAKIRKKFESPDSIGPVWTVNFEAQLNDEERELMQRDAFERVNAFLDRLEIDPFTEPDKAAN